MVNILVATSRTNFPWGILEIARIFILQFQHFAEAWEMSL